MEKFIRELRAAKLRGVDVSKVFVENQEQTELLKVKSFGLRLSIIWVFAAPTLLPIMEAVFEYNHIKVQVPHDLLYWSCGMGFVSILAFGFDLIDLSSLWRGVVRYVKPLEKPKKNPEEITGTHITYRHTDDADGDV